VRHKSVIDQSASLRSTVRDSDEAGEPIQLARADTSSSELNSSDHIMPKLGRDGDNNSAKSQELGQPQQFPDIVQLPISQQPSEPSETATKSLSTFRLPRTSSGNYTRNDNAPEISTDAGGQQESPTVSASDNSTAPTHSETEVTTPVEAVKQTENTSAVPNDSLPLLPSVTNKAEGMAPPQGNDSVRAKKTGEMNQPLPSSIEATTTVTTSPLSIDELPPLPANLTDRTLLDHPTRKPIPAISPTTGPVTESSVVTGSLPSLPNALNAAAEQSGSLSTAVPARNITHDSLDESPNSGDNPPNTASTAIAVIPPVNESHKETEPVPALPGQDKDATVISSVPDIAIQSHDNLAAPTQTTSTQPEQPSDGPKLNELDVNSRLVKSSADHSRQANTPTENNNTAINAPPLLPPAIESSELDSSPDDLMIPHRTTPPSTLHTELKREVESIARKQEDELRRRQQGQPGRTPRDTVISDLRAQTQLDISRAPSPAEARPIKAIPVPEDWVPLAPRTWSAQRKYWAAAATCHLPLYFQDPVLERYGHSVEQFLGPIGRFLTYPLDDPAQSNQRNQILQPLFSYGLFALQIAALPYNAIVDPPWEAQYDLGYYRPGDVIPTDLYWLPLHGYGPPLRGSSY
jgi:hypothetical protein